MKSTITGIILLLLICAGESFAQFDIDDFGWWNKSRSTGHAPSPIISTSLDLSRPPFVRYQDMYVHVTPPQYLGFLGETNWIMKDTMPSWSIEWDMRMTSFAATPQIFGRNVVGGGITECYYNSSTGYVQFVAKDTVRNVYNLNGNTSWHSYKIMWDSAAHNLTMSVDGNVTYTYHTRLPNITNDFLGGPTLFAWGSRYQFEASGISTIVTNGGNFTGDFDNIRLVLGGDTTNEVNFNNGALMLDRGQWYEWMNQKPHNYRHKNAYGGYESMAFVNYYTPMILNKPGYTFKDTLKYFTLPEYDITGGGLIQHTTNGGARATINDAAVRNDKILAGGIFNYKSSDTTTTIGNNIALWNGTSWQAVCDTGMNTSSFVYKVGWLNDTAGACSILNVTRWICIFNTTNSHNWRVNADTLVIGFEVLRDSIFFLDGRRLRATDIYTKNTSTVYTFNETWQDIATSCAIGKKGDTLIVAAGLHLYYMYNHAVVETHTIMEYTSPSKFSKGGVWYKGIFAASDGKVFVGGNFKGWDGIASENVGYFKDGSFHSMGNLGGLTGNCTDYEYSCLEGAFTNNVTCFAEPYAGEIVITGGFRTANNVPIGSNVVLWNEYNGYRSLDYGSAWTTWTVRTLTKNGYTRLIFTGDGIDAAGLPVGNIWGRYLDAEFRTLKPCLAVTEPGNLTPNSFPATVTASVFSKQQRQVTSKLIYHKNYNGTNDTVVMSQTDSTLLNTDGGWKHNVTGNISGTYAATDTIYLALHAIDDYGNDSTHSWTEVIVYPDPPTGIYAMWEWTDKGDSFSVGTSVTTWTDQVSGLILSQSTASLKPKVSTDGILFDTISYLNNTTISNLTSPTRGFTVLIQMKVVDTNAANFQRIFSYAKTSSTNRFALQIATNSTSTYRKIGTQYFDGVSAYNRTFLTNWGNHYNQFSVFALYGDSVNGQSLRIRDSIGVNQGAPFGSNTNSSGFSLGNSEGIGGMKNIPVKRVWIWLRKLTYAELVQARTAMTARR